jgi:hypothetical protein
MKLGLKNVSVGLCPARFSEVKARPPATVRKQSYHIARGGGMKKCAALTLVAAFAFKGLISAKPRMRAQLYGERFEFISGVNYVYVYLILSNGPCCRDVRHRW